jgi:uncharacterized damage-inducible protein DinB
MLDTLRRSYQYLHWANESILRSAAALDPDDYARDLGVSFRSVHGTLAHMLGAEWLWHERWRGRSPTAVPGYDGWQTAVDLESAWAPVRRDQLDFLSALGPDDLSRVLSYRNFAGQPKAYSLGDVLLHVVNHATYHRGQVTSLVRQLGATPPSTDLVVFLDGLGAGASG